MIRVDLSNVATGTRLAKPIYNERGAVWLKAGTELTDRYLTLLRLRGVAAVFVEEPATSPRPSTRPTSATRATWPVGSTRRTAAGWSATRSRRGGYRPLRRAWST